MQKRGSGNRIEELEAQLGRWTESRVKLLRLLSGAFGKDIKAYRDDVHGYIQFIHASGTGRYDYDMVFESSGMKGRAKLVHSDGRRPSTGGLSFDLSRATLRMSRPMVNTGMMYTPSPEWVEADISSLTHTVSVEQVEPSTDDDLGV